MTTCGSMVCEELLDDGTRRFVLTSGPGVPEVEVSEDCYLGWVMFRARRLEAIADPHLRARCAARDGSVATSSAVPRRSGRMRRRFTRTWWAARISTVLPQTLLQARKRPL